MVFSEEEKVEDIVLIVFFFHTVHSFCHLSRKNGAPVDIVTLCCLCMKILVHILMTKNNLLVV